MNKKKAQPVPKGGFKLRVWFRPAKQVGKNRYRDARTLVKCGCCEESLEIYHGSDHLVEINGVMAPKSEWWAILRPILEEPPPVT